MERLLALLAAHGPCTADRLATLSNGYRWLTRRRLVALWDEDLVSTTGSVWALTERGRARVQGQVLTTRRGRS